MPSQYVAEYVELGYATTVHAAQGSTADVMHGILTGTEDRQLLYTMLTRGRDENHLHVVVDPSERDEEQFLPGIDEHLTTVEILDRIVDRNGAALSATTELTRAASPATQLHEATRRYADAVTTATDRLLGPDAAETLASADGPLPWLPGIPADVRKHPQWSSYLTARAERVDLLADQVRRDTALPASLARFNDVLPPKLRDEVIVWRTANGILDDDRSLLGPTPTERGRTSLRPSPSAAGRRPVPRRRPPWEQRISRRPRRARTSTPSTSLAPRRLERTGMNAGLMLRRASTGDRFRSTRPRRSPTASSSTSSALRGSLRGHVRRPRVGAGLGL